jgi:excisionase family DNA binding protein
MREQTGQVGGNSKPKVSSYLTINQSAEQLNVAYNTIRNAILAGKLPAYKIMGTYRIDPDDLAAYIESCRVETKGREAKIPALQATTLKHLDGARLRAAWTRQGVRVPRSGAGSARSSGSTGGPSDGPES